jgi:Domain of unknown function (DUF4166)
VSVTELSRDAETEIRARRTASRLLPVEGGPATVTSSSHGWTAALVTRRLGLDAPLRSPCALTIEVEVGGGERWTRSFGATTWSSTFMAGPDPRTVLERIGPFAVWFDVEQLEGGRAKVTMRQVRIGRIRLPLPRSFAIAVKISPEGASTVAVDWPGGAFTYDIDVGDRP